MPNGYPIAEDMAPAGSIIMQGPQGPAMQPQALPQWMVEQEAGRREIQDRERIREMLQGVPADQSLQGLEMAIRLEGALGFQSDVQAGEDPGKAIVKWAPKLYFQHPQAMAQGIRELRTQEPIVRQFPGTKIPDAVQMGNQIRWAPASAMEEEFTPTMKPYVDEEGNVKGTWYQTGKRSGAFRENTPSWEAKRAITALEKDITAERKSLTSANEAMALIDARRKPESFATASNTVAQAQARIAALKGQQEAILKSTLPGAGPVGAASPTAPPFLTAPAPAAPTTGGRRPLTVDAAREFLKQAKGDKAKARELARQAGYSF
jgi:hypothetical protein